MFLVENIYLKNHLLLWPKLFNTFADDFKFDQKLIWSIKNYFRYILSAPPLPTEKLINEKYDYILLLKKKILNITLTTNFFFFVREEKTSLLISWTRKFWSISVHNSSRMNDYLGSSMWKKPFKLMLRLLRGLRHNKKHKTTKSAFLAKSKVKEFQEIKI